MYVSLHICFIDARHQPLYRQRRAGGHGGRYSRTATTGRGLSGSLYFGFSCWLAEHLPQAYSRDPVNTMNLRNFALEKLAEVSLQNGQETVTSLIDPDILQQLTHPPPPPEQLRPRPV